MALPLLETALVFLRPSTAADMSLSWSAKEHKNSNPPAVAGAKRPRNDVGNKVTVVLGAQWGDEGKGKVVDLLATEADVVCRCQVDGSEVVVIVVVVVCAGG